MVLYLIGIVGGDIAICIFNLIFNRPLYNYPIWFGILAAVLGAIGVIAIDGVCATVVRRCLPEKWFDYTVDFHDPSKKEIKFYEKIWIKKWKDYVLELGMFTNFSKKSVQNPNDVAYLERFILENNYGVWCHLTGAFLGFLLILFYPSYLKLSMALPVCIINFILSMLPTLILRYNTNRLRRTRAVLIKKNERMQKQEQKSEE